MNMIQRKRAVLGVTTGVLGFILPQNGVTEGAMHFGSGDSAPHIAMGSLDSHNGNVGPNDATKRPTNLAVKQTNGFVKNLVENSDDIEDGSLPSTPELLPYSELEVSSCPAGDEVLENDTRQLVSRFLRDFTGLSKSQWHESKALKTMKRVVEDVLAKHRYAFNGMINKLSLDDTGDDASFVSKVARELFADKTTNWGRIATLVAFGAVVALYQKEKGGDNYVELVGQEISNYLLSEQREWLVQNNSWDGFVEFFRVSDPESAVRNTLMAVAGVAGLGATLALLISRARPLRGDQGSERLDDNMHSEEKAHIMSAVM